MDRIKNIYQNLTESQIKQAVLEISAQHETGCYTVVGVLRQIQDQISEIIDSRYSIEDVVHGVTWEISRRWYNGFYGMSSKYIEE